MYVCIVVCVALCMFWCVLWCVCVLVLYCGLSVLCCYVVLLSGVMCSVVPQYYMMSVIEHNFLCSFSKHLTRTQ